MKIILVFLLLSLPFFTNTHQAMTDKEREGLLPNLEALNKGATLLKQRMRNCTTEGGFYMELFDNFVKACNKSQDPKVLRAEEALTDKTRAIDITTENIRNSTPYRQGLASYQTALRNAERTTRNIDNRIATKPWSFMKNGERVRCSWMRLEARGYRTWGTAGASNVGITIELFKDDFGLCSHLQGEKANQCEVAKNQCLEEINKREFAFGVFKNSPSRVSIDTLNDQQAIYNANFIVTCMLSEDPKIVEIYNQLSRHCTGIQYLTAYFMDPLLREKTHQHSNANTNSSTTSSSSKATR